MLSRANKLSILELARIDLITIDVLMITMQFSEQFKIVTKILVLRFGSIGVVSYPRRCNLKKKIVTSFSSINGTSENIDLGWK